MRRDVYQAIADPNRRRILHLVSDKPLNLNSVASEFKISRPAVSKHVRILKESGLVSIRKEGRERYCVANLSALREISDWIEQYRKFWEEKLDALEAYLKQLQKKDKKDGDKK